MSIASAKAWFNGRIVDREEAAPSVASNSFHMGTGVFDGLMAYRNDGDWYLHHVEDHLARLRRGARNMGMPLPWSIDTLVAAVRELLTTTSPSTHYIRPIVYRGGPELMLVSAPNEPVDLCMFAVPVSRDVDTPLHATLVEVRRVSARAIPVGWKVCGAYANSYVAQAEALSRGFDTAVMLATDGTLAEASTSNLFFVDGDELVTPALTPDIFPGITRGLVMELASELGFPTREATLRPADLTRMSAGFSCATLMELRAFARIDDVPLDPSHPLVKQVVERFRDLTRQST